MKQERTAEIIACCEGIIRNAERIAREFEHDTCVEITVRIESHEAPEVIVRKSFIPKEVLHVWNRDNPAQEGQP